MDLPKKESITGVQVAYFIICKRKLWLFSHQIGMEQSSEKVKLGSLLHETSYKRKMKEVELESIKIDFLENKGEIHEVKKSRKIEDAHEFQMLYYLFYLKKKGIPGLKGVIDYPLLRRRKEVMLDRDKEIQILKILREIESIIEQGKPPLADRLPYCKSCSYYNFCWC